jgi:hypothetical protein
MFLIPPVASVILFTLLWWEDLLPRPHVVGACVLVGVVGQWFATTYSVNWVVALQLNVGVAIYLTITLKLNRAIGKVPADD